MKAIKLRQILVPIDFSPKSLETLRYTKLLAKRLGAKLHLVHVVTPPPPFPLGRGMLPLAFSGKQIAAGLLKRLKSLAAEYFVPPQLARYTVRGRAAADKINEIAHESGADLIAISTLGYTGLKHAFLGSTTGRVVRSAPCTVLVVRDLEHQTARQRARRGRTPLQFQKILVPLDFSECSRLGLNYALGFAREFRASLVLFHSVVIQSYALGDEYTALEVPNLLGLQQDYADDEMKALRDELAESNLEIASKVSVGSLVEQIDEFVRANAVDLIIAATHGR
jgi:nucleotide-binding universal stress UspA family protein